MKHFSLMTSMKLEVSMQTSEQNKLTQWFNFSNLWLVPELCERMHNCQISFNRNCKSREEGANLIHNSDIQLTFWKQFEAPFRCEPKEAWWGWQILTRFLQRSHSNLEDQKQQLLIQDKSKLKWLHKEEITLSMSTSSACSYFQ